MMAHWNSRSETYNRFVVNGYRNIREKRSWQKLYSDALGSHGMKVLDVGCGPGILSMQLADSGFTVTGVDFSEEMLRHARENSEANDLDIRFINADATDLPFDDGEFDAVVSGYMLWTVSDPAAVISEWYRVLRPGGRLVYVDGDWMHDSRMTPMRMRLSSWASRIDDPDRKEEDDDGGIMGSLWSSE